MSRPTQHEADERIARYLRRLADGSAGRKTQFFLDAVASAWSPELKSSLGSTRWHVEVSVDDGASWKPATVDYAGSRLTWSLWSYQWKPDRPGQHKLVVRTFDGAGRPQIDKNKDVTGWREHHDAFATAVLERSKKARSEVAQHELGLDSLDTIGVVP